MKISIIVLAAVILALALPSVAFANDPVEMNAGAEGATGDKLDLTVSGDHVEDLSGMAKLNCKNDPMPDTQEIVLIVDSTVVSMECGIELRDGSDDVVIIIDICVDPPTITVTDDFGDSDDCLLLSHPLENRAEAQRHLHHL